MRNVQGMSNVIVKRNFLAMLLAISGFAPTL